MSAPVAAAPPAQGSSSAVKIILIIVAVVVGLGIIGIGAVSYIGWRIAHGVHVNQRNGDVKVETPFGTVQSSSDSTAVAQDIGIDPYPGAESVKNGASTMDIGSMHTVTMQLQTDDAPDKVAAYYKDKVSNVTYSTNQGDHYTMMAGDRNNMTTISIEPQMGKTHIIISKVVKK
jgi:hypothetical protein